MNGAPQSYWIRLSLLSDTTFGRGDGVAGLVDSEVQHDELGLPYLGGKTLKGLLGAECAEILFALERAGGADLAAWQAAAHFLFGRPGSRLDEAASMAVGDARLPSDLRSQLAQPFAQAADPAARHQLRSTNLESLTALRRQTAMDAVSGAPRRNTLRTMRVVLRTTIFDAPLTFATPPPGAARSLLAACTRALRRAGTGRNRGRGRLSAELYAGDPADAGTMPVTDTWFDEFTKAVLP